jgi:type I restriction enzyme S subunit
MRSAEFCPVWCEQYFNSPDGRHYFETASKQTTNLASINMRQVRSCPIPFPPLAEQHRIVAKVNELMTLCDALETHITSAIDTSRQFLEAILQEALCAG